MCFLLDFVILTSWDMKGKFLDIANVVICYFLFEE